MVVLSQGEPAALLLAIDVSASALRGGHLDFVTQQIHTLLTSLNRYISHTHIHTLSFTGQFTLNTKKIFSNLRKTFLDRLETSPSHIWIDRLH